MGKNNFKDHFSVHSEKYSKYRPDYPAVLFKFLSSITPGHDLAWDCATGSGQAARGLVKYFQKVIATDASEQQIKNAIHHKKISYKVAPAHKTTIQTESMDLIAVAQALHWFEFDQFYKEADRVLKQDGIIAAWTYNLLTISPEIDLIIKYFYHNIVGELWPPERTLVENGYENIPFPFYKLPSPSFRMSAKWTIKQLIGYLSTWSAVKRYKDNKGNDPVESIEKELTKLWDNSSAIMEVCWPLSIVIGKKTVT
ncbi:MAG: class I SAM-dependent methyltransferase [Deltaproteobacteria bacterium]|nr:class I SAM-dependent methyltransferase [Deltaproteobacteria bacterium]